MDENKVYKNIENAKIKDNNNRDRNIAGALLNYTYNKVSPLNLGCTRNQYEKFMNFLGKVESLINDRKEREL